LLWPANTQPFLLVWFGDHVEVNLYNVSLVHHLLYGCKASLT
jgi:hypothetical protein